MLDERRKFVASILQHNLGVLDYMDDVSHGDISHVFTTRQPSFRMGNGQTTAKVAASL